MEKYFWVAVAFFVFIALNARAEIASLFRWLKDSLRSFFKNLGDFLFSIRRTIFPWLALLGLAIVLLNNLLWVGRNPSEFGFGKGEEFLTKDSGFWTFAAAIAAAPFAWFIWFIRDRVKEIDQTQAKEDLAHEQYKTSLEQFNKLIEWATDWPIEGKTKGESQDKATEEKPSEKATEGEPKYKTEGKTDKAKVLRAAAAILQFSDYLGDGGMVPPKYRVKDQDAEESVKEKVEKNSYRLPILSTLKAIVSARPKPPKDWDGKSEVEGDIPKVIKEAVETVIRTRGTFVGNDFYGWPLWRMNLYEANLAGANFSEANLKGTHLAKANLQGANLMYANLQGAALIETNLQNASLFKSNLNGAHLAHAKLEGANLEGAKDLTWEQVLTAKYWKGAILPEELKNNPPTIGMIRMVEADMEKSGRSFDFAQTRQDVLAYCGIDRLPGES